MKSVPKRRGVWERREAELMRGCCYRLRRLVVALVMRVAVAGPRPSLSFAACVVSLVSRCAPRVASGDDAGSREG